MAAESKTTTDHEEIKGWAEARKGKPAIKEKGTAQESLTISFPGGKEENITWEEFFDKFEANKLAFLYQDETAAGKQSRFFRFVNRETVSKY